MLMALEWVCAQAQVGRPHIDRAAEGRGIPARQGDTLCRRPGAEQEDEGPAHADGGQGEQDEGVDEEHVQLQVLVPGQAEVGPRDKALRAHLEDMEQQVSRARRATRAPEELLRPYLPRGPILSHQRKST